MCEAFHWHWSLYSFWRKEVQHERSVQINWLLYQFKKSFSYLPLQVSRTTRGYSMEIDILSGRATRIPKLPQSSSMTVSGAGVPLSLWDWGHSHFQWPVCLQAGHGLGGSFWHLWAQWPVDLHLKHSPLMIFTFRGTVKLSWPPWVALRLQSMSDSNGYQFNMSPGLPVSTLGFLFLLSLISVIKYPKGHH